jgi:hypothetical protein
MSGLAYSTLAFFTAPSRWRVGQNAGPCPWGERQIFSLMPHLAHSGFDDSIYSPHFIEFMGHGLTRINTDNIFHNLKTPIYLHQLK